MADKVTAQSYTLRNENGGWLGQVVLTSDGMFSSVTDWGNLSFAWRHFGDDFKEFILQLNIDYFAGKMYSGMVYIAHSKKVEASCRRFAKNILPPIQKLLREEKSNTRDEIVR